MERLNCVIVDDEYNAANLLKLLVEEIDEQIDVAAIYEDPSVALTEIPRLNPDFLFLDVDMPFMTGFQLLEKLDMPDIPVVFVTCLLYTSPSPRDQRGSRMPSSA